MRGVAGCCFDEVDETARCCHSYVASSFECLDLIILSQSTKAGRDREDVRLGKHPCLFVDLFRELARRCQHHSDRSFALLQHWSSDDVNAQGQKISGRLSRSCLGQTDHVTTRQGNWERLHLNRRRDFESESSVRERQQA